MRVTSLFISSLCSAPCAQLPGLLFLFVPDQDQHSRWAFINNPALNINAVVKGVPICTSRIDAGISVTETVCRLTATAFAVTTFAVANVSSNQQLETRCGDLQYGLQWTEVV